MTTPDAINQALDAGNRGLVALHATAFSYTGEVFRRLADRLDPKDDRGDVEARTITIAIMAALALAIGAIIVDKVTDKANTISLDAP